jgi:hypothetical protein
MMFAKASIILTLIVSLLFATQAPGWTLPAQMKAGGGCAQMQCMQGCCAAKACCHVTEQQPVPQQSTPAPRNVQLPEATLDLHAWTFLFLPPAARRPFVIHDEVSAAHTLPPLAASCIRLI